MISQKELDDVKKHVKGVTKIIDVTLRKLENVVKFMNETEKNDYDASALDLKWVNEVGNLAVILFKLAMVSEEMQYKLQTIDKLELERLENKIQHKKEKK